MTVCAILSMLMFHNELTCSKNFGVVPIEINRVMPSLPILSRHSPIISFQKPLDRCHSTKFMDLYQEYVLFIYINVYIYTSPVPTLRRGFRVWPHISSK